MIENTDDLLREIKELCEKKFTPKGSYYVDKIVRNGQTSIVLHMVYDSPNEKDSYPKLKKKVSMAGW